MSDGATILSQLSASEIDCTGAIHVNNVSVLTVRALVESDTRFSGRVKKRMIERVTQELIAGREASGSWTRYLLAELVAKGRARDAIRTLDAAVRQESHSLVAKGRAWDGIGSLYSAVGQSHSLDAIPLELQICRWLYSRRYTLVGALGPGLIATLEFNLELLGDPVVDPAKSAQERARLEALTLRRVLTRPRERLRKGLEAMKANGELEKALHTVEMAMKQGPEILVAVSGWVELLASCDREGLLDDRGLLTYHGAVGMLGQLHIVCGGGRYLTQ